MAHRLAEVLGRVAAAVRACLREPVSLAVVLDHLRMVDGDVGGALLEVVDRVAALGPHRLDQAVGASDCAVRVVDELSLDALPALQVAVARHL